MEIIPLKHGDKERRENELWDALIELDNHYKE